LVKIYAGYYSPFVSRVEAAQSDGIFVDKYELLPRFSGNIVGFQKNRGDKTLTIFVQDFGYKLKSQQNLNYPDLSSYWNFGFFDNADPNQPDGRRAPIAYDKWPVVDAIGDLMIKSGIPHGLLKGKRRRPDNSGGVVSSLNKVVNLGYQLDWTSEYAKENPKKDFNYRFSFGDNLYDAVTGIVDAYGYRFGFDRFGDVYFRPANNPDIIYSDKDIANMLPDSDGRYDLNSRLNLAIVTAGESNLGESAFAVSGIGQGVRFKEVRFEPEKSYYFSFYAKNTAGGSASLELSFDKRSGGAFEDDGNAPWSHTFSISPAGSYSRQSYQIPAGYAYKGYPKVSLNATISGGPLYITDFQLEEFELTAWVYGGMVVDYGFNGGTAKIF